MLILDVSKCPKYVDIRYGENEIKRLFNRFMLNKDDAIIRFSLLIDDQNISLSKCLPELMNFLKTLLCSTAECK